MNKPLVLGGFTLAIALSGVVFGQTTLKETVEQTLKTNPDVLIDVARRQSTDEALTRARSGYFPRVDLNLGSGREKSNNSNTAGKDLSLTRRERGLTLTQMLFDGFATSAEVARNRATLDSRAYRVAGTADEIALKVIEAYLDVLRLNEIVVLTKNNLAAHEKTADQIKMRADSGVGRRADQDQSDARLALARSNLTAAQANVRDAEITFKRYVGMLPKGLVKPATPDGKLIPENVDDAVQVTFKNNPLLSLAKADVEAVKAQHKAAISAMYPRLDLELGAMRNDNVDGTRGQSDNTYAMLRLRYNLFRGGGDKARIAETQMQIYEADETQRRTEYQLEQSTRLSWNALRSASERIPNLKQHADSSLVTREAYTRQFSLGQRSLLDLLDSENELFTANKDYVDGQYTELFAKYRLLADMGNLLDVLGVARPEAATIAAN